MANKLLNSYRDNLYTDRDHSIFRGPKFVGRDGQPTKKMRHLCDPLSEDAVTWSVFRTLQRLDPKYWPRILMEKAYGVSCTSANSSVSFWRDVPPPKERLIWMLEHLDEMRIVHSRGAQRYPDRVERVKMRLNHWLEIAGKGHLRPRMLGCLEGDTELDALIETPHSIIAIEAKYTSDLSLDTRWDTDRDQIGRVIDSGLALATEKEFYFLLVTDAKCHAPGEEKSYEELIRHYQHDLEFVRRKLPHRAEEELHKLLGHIGWLRWSDIVETVRQSEAITTPEQKMHIEGLSAYLRARHLL